MTSLKGNPEKQRKRNYIAKLLNEKRQQEYRQRIVPPKKRNPRKKLSPKEIKKLMETDYDDPDL